MNEKYDLARMLRETSNENAVDATANRTLTQAEIKARVAARTRPAPADDARARAVRAMNTARERIATD